MALALPWRMPEHGSMFLANTAAVPHRPPPLAPLAQSTRAVTLWAELPVLAEGLALAWAAEGLRATVRSLPELSARPQAGQAEAQVLHIAGNLPCHLPGLRALRAAWPQTPLLVLSGSLRDIDQVLALEMGADDVAPADTAAAVLAARLRALWRRGQVGMVPAAPTQDLSFGALSLHRRERVAMYRGEQVPLTEGEFELLWMLASQAGSVVERRDLLRELRGLDDHPMDRSIDCRVYRIRAKLADDAGGAQRIRTVRHRGYVFSPAGW